MLLLTLLTLLMLDAVCSVLALDYVTSDYVFSVPNYNVNSARWGDTSHLCPPRQRSHCLPHILGWPIPKLAGC
eukprot:scaffold266857_cov34-Prasinocladus_malaysianus.AAC.1